jgi:hypothetical protein
MCGEVDQTKRRRAILSDDLAARYLREFKAVAFAILILFAAGASGRRTADAGARETPVDAVSDVYHGVTVADPYRWLENGADPKVHDWSVAQDKQTRAYLNALPLHQPIYDRLFKLNAQTSPYYSRLRPAGDGIFAIYNQPPKQQPMIAMLGRDVDPATARVIVDPNTFDAAGTTQLTGSCRHPTARGLRSRCPSEAARTGRCMSSTWRPARRPAR